jgi:hypothetical protein
MFCRRCYADLNQSAEARCLRCGRPFNPDQPSTYLTRPFPPRWRIIFHTLLTLILATIVSAVVAGFLAVAQLKHLHSGH